MTSRITRVLPRRIANLLSPEENEDITQLQYESETPSLLGFAALHLVSDERLVEKLKAGDHDALTILYSRRRHLVHCVAWRILRSETEADDVVQETFIDLFRVVETYDHARSTVVSWLVMIAYRRAIDKRRNLEAKRYYTTESLEDDHVRRCLERGARRAFPLHPPETARLIEQALAMLRPRQRGAIELIYYEGLTVEEAAARSGMSAKTVANNYYRGLTKLRKLIDTGQRESETKENAKQKKQREGADALARVL